MDTRIAIRQLSALSRRSRGMRLAAQGWDAPWKMLIATIMSAQSRDEVTIAIAEKLFERYGSLQRLSRARYRDVLGILHSLNYNRTKSRHIIACAKELCGKYGGVVPEYFDKLVSLPGVGRKTANVFLAEMGHDAIGVDTHAAYVSQKLGWTRNKRPHKIEQDLKALFPKMYWSRINPTLVTFGKAHTSRKQKDKLLEEIGKIR